MMISRVTQLNNNSLICKNNSPKTYLSNQDNSLKPSFKGGFKEPKALASFIDKVAEKYVKMLGSKQGQNLINWTEKHPGFKKNYFAHLIVLGSTLLSGMYVVKTINNKKLDAEKRRTLAINQGAVFALSTVMAYTFDKMLNKKTDAVITKFKTLNKNLGNLDQCVDGIKKGKSIVVIDSVYRFIAPVLVTPIANHIGNKINEKKAAKRAALDKQA